MDWHLDKGEILKIYKNEFEWLKTIFFMKEGIHDHFCKVSSDFKPFWQVTIFHTRLSHTPDFPTHQIMDWDLDKGEILKTYNNEFDRPKTIFFMKEGICDHFWKVSSDLKPFWKLPYLTQDFPTNQIMDWNLDKGEYLKTNKKEFDWLKTIFFVKEGIRNHFWKVSSDLKPFWQVTIFHTRLRHKPNHWLGFRQGWNYKNFQKKFDWLKTIFFMKEGIRDHFCKVSSDLKQFWQVTIFHTRLPHKPNHGLGLRQGWNSKNLQKWVWIAQNDIFHERRHTRSFLQSFKWFKAILTSYHILHQTSPQTKSWVWT